MCMILGILRAACFSPGMVERDEAILRAVMVRLHEHGHHTRLIHEEEFTIDIPIPHTVLHMARSSEALAILAQWQAAGCRVLNPVEGILSIERAALARLCAQQGIATPTTWIVPTASPTATTATTTEDKLVPITFPCWIKRAGSCAQCADDVCRADDCREYSAALTRLHTRGITQAVVMEHLEGSIIKFYAVQGTPFSYCIPAASLGYDKFATDSCCTTDTHAEHYAASITHLLNNLHSPLPIFGGDAVLGHDGIARLIDLNDWPSFSACREAAADAIAYIAEEPLP